MHSAFAGFVFLLAVPAVQAGTAPPKSQCRSTCSSTYNLCMKRSNTKVARKACKTQHKACKKGCRG